MNFKYKTPKGELHCRLSYNETDNYYTLKALDGRKEMGFATFKITNEYYSRKLWLNFIGTNKNYEHKGVATNLIKIVEYFAYCNKLSKIGGKYYPENEYAEPFYNKNGYEIEHEYYDWYINKDLDMVIDDVIKVKDNLIFEKEADEEKLF